MEWKKGGLDGTKKGGPDGTKKGGAMMERKRGPWWNEKRGAWWNEKKGAPTNALGMRNERKVNLLFYLTTTFCLITIFRCVRDTAKNDYSIPSCLSVCRSVRPSSWNTSASIGLIFMEFDKRVFENLSRKFFLLKSDKNNGYLTWRPMYIFVHISLILS